MKCLLCASCDSLRAVLPCRIWFGYWLLELSDRLAPGSVRNPGVYRSASCQRSAEVVKQMLHLLVCHLKKHLHKLCHAINCCIRVPIVVEQHCVVIACATVTCGAWYGTFCWLLHCWWFISWSLFSTWINCIIFSQGDPKLCSPLTDLRSRTFNLKCQWVHPRLHSILQKGIHIVFSHFTVLSLSLRRGNFFVEILKFRMLCMWSILNLDFRYLLIYASWFVLWELLKWYVRSALVVPLLVSLVVCVWMLWERHQAFPSPPVLAWEVKDTGRTF